MKGKTALLTTCSEQRPPNGEATDLIRTEVSVFHQGTGRTDSLLRYRIYGCNFSFMKNWKFSLAKRGGPYMFRGSLTQSLSVFFIREWSQHFMITLTPDH
jgi:hypothetical protein